MTWLLFSLITLSFDLNTALNESLFTDAVWSFLYQHTCAVSSADPSGFDEVADGLQQQWQASVQVLDQQHNQTTNQQQQQPSNQHQQSSIQQIDKDTLASDTMNSEPFPSTPASLQQSVTSEDTDRASALNAFSQPNIVRQYEQVRTRICITSYPLGVGTVWNIQMTLVSVEPFVVKSKDALMTLHVAPC